MGEVAFVSHDAVAIVFEVSALLRLILGVVDLGAVETIVLALHLLAHVVLLVVDLVGGDVLLLGLLLLGVRILLRGLLI